MATIRKRELPSGKVVWQADYRDGEGKRRSKQFPLKKNADAFLLTARGEVKAGVHVADSQSITVSEASDHWLNRADSEGLEASTRAQYKAHVTHHILPLLGTTKLNKINAPSVQAFVDDLSKDRSRAMVKKVLASLSGIFSEAQRLGLAVQNPVAAVRVRMPKRDKIRLEMPTKSELQAILKATPEKHAPFIYTAIFTGMRASELRGLSWDSVDLKKAIISVVRRADPYNEIGPPKSEAGTRDIPVPPIVTETLRKWQKICPKGAHNLVFPNGAGNIESHANLLNRVFWPIQIAAGICTATGEIDEDGKAIQKAKFSLHALRHAAAALWIEQGAKPKRIQVLMGHASIQQTFDTYGYLFPSEEDDQSAIKSIQDRLIPAQ